jgi:hypothetical protein
MMAGGALGHAGSDHLTDERARQRLFFRQANSAAPSANKRAVRGRRDHDGDAESAIA